MGLLTLILGLSGLSHGGPRIPLLRVLGSFRPFTTRLMHQGVAHRAIPGCRDDIGISHTREHVALS
jgi:hypothetical protein